MFVLLETVIRVGVSQATAISTVPLVFIVFPRLFIILVFVLEICFFLLGAGYFDVASGNAARIARSAKIFKAAGAFAFITSACACVSIQLDDKISP